MGGLLSRDGGRCISAILDLSLVLLILAVLNIIFVLEEWQWTQSRLDSLKQNANQAPFNFVCSFLLLLVRGISFVAPS